MTAHPTGRKLTIHSNFPRYEDHDPQVPVWCVTPGKGGCFHRFFDTSPISPSGRHVAVLRMPDESRLNEPGEPAEIVLVDLQAGDEKVIAETRGWEPQMGANINWGADDHHLFFNDVDTETWTPQLVRFDPLTGRAAKTPGGVYHVSPDGRHAAAACMKRMRRTQRGYGVVVPDDLVPVNVGAPDDDGLFITDLATGGRKLVLPLRRAMEASEELTAGDLEEWQIYGFHTKWSSDGRRLIFTIRRVHRDEADAWNNLGKCRFEVLTCKPDGSDLRNAVPARHWEHGGHHIHWFPDSRQLSMNLGGFGEGLRFVRVGYDGSDLRPILDDVPGSGHPSVHPCGRLLTDAYAHEGQSYGDGSIPLRWVDTASGEERKLVRMHSRMEPMNDRALRVDAHPAWDRTWRWLAFNGVQDNTRRLYIADMADVIG